MKVRLQPRTIVCPCGETFASKEITARYCSDDCRKRYGRFGRSYGTVVPRVFGFTKG